MRKIWDIPGGVHPPENKRQSTQVPIGTIRLPEEIILPLSQHLGSAALPIVQIGQQVLKGQRVADAQGLVSAPVHASTSGTVRAIEERYIPHPSGLKAPCIVITPDGLNQWQPMEECEDYLALDKNVLLKKVREAGIAGLGGAGFPTAVKLNPRADFHIHTLIINGSECEPYITADDVLMRERADEVIAGALLFAKLLGNPQNIMVGIEDNKPEAIAAMEKAARETPVEIIHFPTKYPSGGEKQLVQIVTGKEVPSSGIPAELGVVVQNAGTAAAAYRAVRHGEPLISRITTVVGESLGIQRNIEVLLGTPINHILNEHRFNNDNCARLIIGGPMMGFPLERTDVPIIKTTNCLLAPSHAEMPSQAPAQACIRCGMCAEACPASLLPQQLFWYSQAEEIDKLKSHHLFDCIECGACAYVCPSNIPLVQYYRASKGIIRQMENDKQKSDRSRQRFEYRKERIARAEADREAKRMARKKAAEEAKKILTEQSAGMNSGNTTAINFQTQDTDTQRAKIERALASALNRVEHTQEQLAAEKLKPESTRIEILKARLKQAEQKLSNTKTRLANLDNSNTRARASEIKDKMTLSPRAKQEKNIATLTRHLATAEEKFAEVEQRGSPSAEALKQGVEKLRRKLVDAKQELDALSPKPTSVTEISASLSAADAAIAKAQANAAIMASMSEEEKAQVRIESLKNRLEKAKLRLKKAESENSEHLEAFKNSVDKLEQKLREAQS